MNNWINYQHLRYFLTIASEGGVARAAAKLKLAQSTLSTQLKQFESQLGTPLFERRQKRLHLNEAGRIALKYASEIFKLGDEMLDALSDRREAHRVGVQVGALDSIPKGVVASLVSAAQAFQPCAVSVVEGRAEEILAKLKAHEIDLAMFGHMPLSGEDLGILARRAGRMAVAVYGSARFAALAKGFPQSLSGQPFVMPGAASRIRHDVGHYLKLHKISVDVILEAQDSSLLTLLAAAGAGLIPAAETSAHDLRKQHGLRMLGVLDDVHEELWLVGGARRIENPVASFLLRNFTMQQP